MKTTFTQPITCTAEESPSGREFPNVALLGVPHAGESLVIEDDSTRGRGTEFVIEEVVHRSVHGVAALHLRIRRVESAGATADPTARMR